MTYTFTSLVRRGFTPNAAAEAPITVHVVGEADISHTVAMMTPADVVGIAPRQVIRSWPGDGVRNAEPNYLALVEFDAPDLPWLFSRPGAGGRVHPWVVLAVIDETELGVDPLDHSAGPARITVPTAQLPDPSEAWLWSHAQLLGTDTVPDDPARSLSRLVCPRRLHPDHRYLGCVVPTFEAGRLAGLGQVFVPDDPLRTSDAFAWDPRGAADVTLPVYHWFRFSTGASGDFESLVRRLHGVPLPAGLGRRRLRLDHPLSTLPTSGHGDLELHVALRPPGAVGAPTEDVVGAGYLTELRKRLSDAGYEVALLDDSLPRVGPPVYGQLAAGVRAAQLDAAPVPPWLREVNVDPRVRVAAGLGAEVVRRNQEHYVEEAWRQVGDVVAANRLRRRAEFSLAATSRLFTRWISGLDAGDLVTATSPVHAKVLVGPGETVVGRLRDSPVPPAVAGVELRRFARARGALAHASTWQEDAGVRALALRSTDAEPLTQRLPLDSIEALEPPSRLWGVEGAKEVLGRLVTGGVAGLEPTLAAAQLDAASTVVAFDLPTADVVSAHVAAAGAVDLDRTLSSIGLVPRAAVLEAVAVAPPDHAPEPDGPHVDEPIEPLPHEPGGPVVAGPIDHGEGLAAAGGHHLGGIPVEGPAEGHFPLWRRGQGEGVDPDLVLVRAGGLGNVLGPVIPAIDVIATVREHPGLVTRVGEEVVIDTERLSASSRVGLAATSIEPAVFAEVVAGTFRPPVPPVTRFDVPVDRVGDVRTELGEVVVRLADLVLRPGDTASAPGRPLAGGLEGLRPRILAALDPSVTIRRAVNSRISDLLESEDESLDDIMAAPDLSEPTYSQLASISHDWLLPGLDQLPTDTTTLVAANRDFIAGFLVGMNHELARELLWREYPTDQRGTYARQFWTHLSTSQRSDQFDLEKELHAAPDSTLAGLTWSVDPPPQGVPLEDPLVLVVKGELVERYPGVIVCAARTRKTADGTRVPATITMPDFVGVLEPDVMLVGFTSLTASMVRADGADPDGDTAWWFFFAEHFTEPRFGLDELEPDDPNPPDPETWNDAAWQHATLDRGFLHAGSSSLDLRKGTDLTSATSYRWGSTAAAQAWITLQFPFRRGILATDLLPPEETP